ncbi:MAG: heparan-alpha-glucosaminide N-acetyltransferase domain-containing protein [Acidobacteriota bacterium]|nr:heparan-alpha-glucosaminide N-acetyltransferase domain-containing protein [Acidobacteriota bacterium]
MAAPHKSENIPQARGVHTPDPLAPEGSRLRLDSVDVLRGIVMVVMALDHVRDYLTHLSFQPEDVPHTYFALWITRWVTHYCAPSFFFLAGTGAFLSYARGKSKAQIAHFLWTRGLWLILLEFTVVGFGWTFIFPFPWGGVLWALGWSMVINSAIVRLPTKWIVAIGAVMVAGHNLLDNVQPAAFGKLGWLWTILHQPGFIPLTPPAWLQPHLPPGAPFGFFVLYPLVPWIGVMALGFAFGEVLRRTPADRQRWTLRAGLIVTAAFIVLRATNIYGNPHQNFFAGTGLPDADFHLQATLANDFILFTDVAKYPPSLQFLLMTLGPALIALSFFDRIRISGPGLAARVARFFVVFGRVPMFYYVLHLYVIHLMAIAVASAFGQPHAHLWRGGFMLGSAPPGFGFNLPFIYLMWIAVVLVLYYPCLWLMRLKQRRRDWWLSYM